MFMAHSLDYCAVAWEFAGSILCFFFFFLPILTFCPHWTSNVHWIQILYISSKKLHLAKRKYDNNNNIRMFTCSYKAALYICLYLYVYVYVYVNLYEKWVIQKPQSQCTFTVVHRRINTLPTLRIVWEVCWTLLRVHTAPCKSFMRGSAFTLCLDGLFFSQHTCSFSALIKTLRVYPPYSPYWPLNKSPHYVFPVIVTMCMEWKKSLSCLETGSSPLACHCNVHSHSSSATFFFTLAACSASSQT